MRDTLLLNADFAPLGIVAWQRAVTLVMNEKARAVETYPDRVVRSPGLELAWPSVVHLVEYRRFRRRPGPGRLHVLARDDYTCQYCGERPLRASGRPDVGALTLDHVVPRSRAVDGRVEVDWADAPVSVNSWENLVAACGPCNHGKADRTPEEAGLSLRRIPTRPSPREAFAIVLARASIPDAWEAFLGH